MQECVCVCVCVRACVYVCVSAQDLRENMQQQQLLCQSACQHLLLNKSLAAGKDGHLHWLSLLLSVQHCLANYSCHSHLC